MSQTFCLEPDIIAAGENVMPDVNNDLVLAKNFLKQQSAATGDSLYDHLVDLIQKILTQKPPNVVDNFEHYSWEVKKDKFRPNFDMLTDVYLSPPQLEFVKKIDVMFEIIASKAAKLEDMGEEELDLGEEGEEFVGKVADLIEHNYYFREGGYGLPDCECYAVYIAMRMLAIKEPVSTVRFFGKIFGMKANYYIAETDLTVDELERRIRAFDLKEMPGEGEEHEGDLPPEQVDTEEKSELGEGEAPVPEGPQPPKLPPYPLNMWKPTLPTPVERPGQGVNKKVYWVCRAPGDAWECLPDVTPEQIRVCRQTVRCMVGDLDAEINSHPPFPGTERQYLRAQVARIAAATAVSPQGFYTFGSGEEEEDFDMEEGGDMDFNLNPFYQGHTLKDLLDHTLTYWVHHGRHILKQGRTIWFNPTIGMEEGLEEEEQEARVEPETGPALMTPLSDDARLEGVAAWTPRVSSALLPDRALVTLRSGLWPGAVAYSNVGKRSECMYIGWGLKCQQPNFTPAQLPPPQDEYPLGPEVMEMADPTFAEEEAYRIAHLPPPPPPELPGEGEGLGEEEEDEDDDEEEEEEE